MELSRLGVGTQQVLQRSAPPEGVTAGNLRKLDGDGDGQVSEQEAGSAGIDQKDRESINQALRQSAGYEARQIVFPTKSSAPARGAQVANTDDSHSDTEAIGNTKTYSQLWKKDRDAGTDAPTVNTADELKTKLGVKDWADQPQVKALVDLLHAQNLDTPQNLTYLALIAERHGNGTLSGISATLTDYYTNGAAATGVAKNDILQGALHDVAIPSDIDQANRGTCGAAAIQMKFAIEKPQQYVNMLTTLAQNKNFTTAGGDTVKPNNSWQGDATDGRQPSTKIMQNAIMDLARPGGSAYNSGTNDMKGTYNSGERSAIQSLYGKSDEYDLDEASDTFTSKSDLYQYVEDDIARGRAVSVSFKGHSVTVVGIDKTQSPNRVIMDSWGGQYSMTVDEFKSQVQAVRSVDDSGFDSRRTAAGSKTMVGDR